MEMIYVTTGLDASVGLETKVGLTNLNLNLAEENQFPGMNNITLKKQWLKKDGTTVHNEVIINLPDYQETDEAVKAARVKAIEDFKLSIKTQLTKLITALL